ncbi:hypothetical protein EXIGLDRAFT_837958 [Exidia glandulosa HHB12029]|uniref:Cyclin N-terminal domain-containing protein n=1 Tax=Exidia glandulosa HHB12029 TaxID=1314781 RepID=A0A165GBF7_EXIGL|nr:hypothetical protein EXIGLDRAFT_837958 [Exidia glandulosa HHB12029]
MAYNAYHPTRMNSGASSRAVAPTVSWQQGTIPTSIIAADPFYGHERTAKSCAAFILRAFSCLDYPLSSMIPAPALDTATSLSPPVSLAEFIGHIIHRTRLSESVTLSAIALLARFKTRFPHAKAKVDQYRGLGTGHRLFLSAFMIASKTIEDNNYSQESWRIVSHYQFSAHDISEMEREMLYYLQWVVNVPVAELGATKDMLRNIYGNAE